MNVIRDQTWEGSLNIKITLDPRDSNEQTASHHYYITVPRDSYIALYLPQLLGYFKKDMLVPEWLENVGGWWFEAGEDGCDGPLKWNYPIGLCKDLVTCGGGSISSVWSLLLRYRDYPHEYVIEVAKDERDPSSLDYLQDYWINQLKQLCFVIHGSAKPIMSLSKDDTLTLWESVSQRKSLHCHYRNETLTTTDNFSQYSAISSKIIPTVLDLFRNIPIRIYLPITQNNVIQPLINPLDSKTIGDMLQDAIPDLFMIDDDVYKVAYPVIHGINIPKHAPLGEIYQMFKYIDGWLHVGIVIR